MVKDMFLVMYMDVDEDATTAQVNDLFKSASRNKYIEHRYGWNGKTKQ